MPLAPQPEPNSTLPAAPRLITRAEFSQLTTRPQNKTGYWRALIENLQPGELLHIPANLWQYKFQRPYQIVSRIKTTYPEREIICHAIMDRSGWVVERVK